MNIIEEIVDKKRHEVEYLKQERPISYLEKLIANSKPALNFSSSLYGLKTHLIAEVKRASPSKGNLRLDIDPVDLARIYELYGAAAISVLTESNYFKGSLDILVRVKNNVNIPVLRKDFIVDRYQVYESCANGADAILLIAAILSDKELGELQSLSHSLGMECLVEVHNKEEMEKAIRSNATIIGINNRDLSTFSVDIKTTESLKKFIPSGTIIVSESGIHSRQDMLRLHNMGINAALIGEALVTSKNIPAKMKELIL